MPQRARLHSNWAYFAVLYTLMAFAMGGIAFAALLAGYNFPGFELALSESGFVVAAMLAGLRYVKQHGNVWTSRERHHLAMVYLFTTLVVSAGISALLMVAAVLNGEAIGDVSEMVQDRLFQVILVIMFLFWLGLNYGLARLALFVVDRAAHAGAGQTQ
jgi:hypothetical protein